MRLEAEGERVVPVRASDDPRRRVCRTPEADPARLHEAFVAWADDANRASDRATEFEEILGYHMEQAYQYRVALAPLD